MKRYDPLHLFGDSFSDEYVKGFYLGMNHLADQWCIVPEGHTFVLRLTTYPEWNLRTPSQDQLGGKQK